MGRISKNSIQWELEVGMRLVLSMKRSVSDGFEACGFFSVLESVSSVSKHLVHSVDAGEEIFSYARLPVGNLCVVVSCVPSVDLPIPSSAKNQLKAVIKA